MDNSNELWKDIPGWDGAYQASRNGEIRSVGRTITTSAGWNRESSSRILKPWDNGNGYRKVELFHGGGVSTKHFVHRLVAETFLSNPGEYPLVNHKNEIRHDNRVDNLEFCTHKYNVRYNDAHMTKAKAVVQYDLEGNEVNTFISMTEAAKQLPDVTVSGISACVNGNRRVHAGYTWQLKNNLK